MGRAPSPLSTVSVTSARPSGARPAVPAKMTSSILPPRRALAPCSPSTQAMASTTLDLPEPFGPTTQVMPGSSRNVVAEAKDLKPLTVKLLRCTDLRRSLALFCSVAGYPPPGRRTGYAARPAPLPLFPAILELWLPFRGLRPGLRQPQVQDRDVSDRAKRCAPPLGGGAL